MSQDSVSHPSGDNIIEVIGRDGWRKEFPLQKTIVFIGSDPQADILLEGGAGGGVAPRHLQVIVLPEVGYRLVNLGDSDVFLGPAGERGLAPRFSTDLADGTQIKVGDFTLVFRGVASSGDLARPGGGYRQSQHLGLRVSLPQKHLAPHRTLAGVITVSNLGDHPGAQMELEFEGLARDYFELEPGPLLSSGAEKEVSFRLYHRGATPLAGDYRLIISAAAPKAYPAEQVSVTQMVSFLPLYEHKLTLTPVRGTPEPKTPAAAPASPASRHEPILSVISHSPPGETVGEPGSGSVWGEPPPPATIPIILVEPPASPRPQPEPLPAGVEAPLAIEPEPASEPEPPLEPNITLELEPSVEPVLLAAPMEEPPPSSPAVEPPEPGPTETLSAETASPGPAVEPSRVVPIQPAGSLPARLPGATAEWWEETPPAGTVPAQKVATSAGEDWWATPETTPARPASRPAMKLKATVETPDPGPTGEPPPATADDWWTSPPPPAPPAESPEQQKTKAKKQA